MMRAAALAIALLAQGLVPAHAQQATQDAAALLSAAAREFDAATQDDERLAALGAAAAAQEQALAALRDELRRIAQRRADLTPRSEEAAREAATLGLALARLHRTPPTGWFAHPGGPLAASRTGMAMAEIAPALAARADALRGAIVELDRLEAERGAASALSHDALAALRATRAEIAARSASRRAAAARSDSPEAAARLAEARDLLSRAAATLTDAVTALPPRPAEAAPELAIAELRGLLPPPAIGRIVMRFGAETPEGPARGLTLSVAPYAVVRAPTLSTLRYSGPVGRFEQVAILEAEPGALIVLAGLGAIDRAVGETILPGEPIGAMSGPPPQGDEFLIDATRGNGTLSEETLYIEMRRDGAPVDPAPWFAFPAERKSG